MNTLLHLLYSMLQAAAHYCRAVFQPLLQDALEFPDLRPAIQADHVQINPITALQVGGGKQVRHQFCVPHPIGARHKHQTDRVFMI